jgi:hypothetical protein
MHGRKLREHVAEWGVDQKMNTRGEETRSEMGMKERIIMGMDVIVGPSGDSPRQPW